MFKVKIYFLNFAITGQEVHARRLVSTLMHSGGWVLLQNCHLGLDFMDELLETVLTAENVHVDYRTWVTAEEHPKFPITLLQSSIKVISAYYPIRFNTF